VKVFFDTNVYVAEALLGQVAEQLLEVTEGASWRIYASLYLLDELERDLRVGFERGIAREGRVAGAERSDAPGQRCEPWRILPQPPNPGQRCEPWGILPQPPGPGRGGCAPADGLSAKKVSEARRGRVC
jgi:hypothetical protein